MHSNDGIEIEIGQHLGESRRQTCMKYTFCAPTDYVIDQIPLLTHAKEIDAM